MPNINLFKSTVIGRFISSMAYKIHSCECLNINHCLYSFRIFIGCDVFNPKKTLSFFSIESRRQQNVKRYFLGAYFATINLCQKMGQVTSSIEHMFAHKSITRVHQLKTSAQSRDCFKAKKPNIFNGKIAMLLSIP